MTMKEGVLMKSTLFAVSNEMAALVEEIGRSVVSVDARRRLPASGVAWSADGLVVTANHIVQRDENISVGLGSDARVEAQLVGRDPGTDLALLRVDAELVPAAWVNADDLSVGQLALALGRPGQTVQASLGIVNAHGGAWRTATGGQVDAYVQADLVMYPGFSGGPLAVAGEAGGAVAGITTSALLRGASLVVPTSTVRRVVEALLAHGHIPRAFLGVGLQPVRLNPALQQDLGQESGLMVMSLDDDGPAAAAGVVQGDIIVSLGDDRMRHIDDLQSALAAGEIGAAVAVRVVRGGILSELTVVMGQR